MNDSTTTNGRGQRKTLASQLDRLDSIIDVLADGLNEAVGDAVKQAVTTAVQEAVAAAVQALLSNPDLVRHLAAQASPAATPPPAEPAAPEPARPSRRRSLFSRVGLWLADRVRQVRRGLGAARCWVVGLATGFWERLGPVRRFQVPLLVAAVVGTAVGLVAFHAGPPVAAAAGWLGGFFFALAVQAGLALRRLLPAGMSAA